MNQKLFELIESMTGYKCQENELDKIIQAALHALKPDVWWNCPVPPFFIPLEYNWVAQHVDSHWYAFEYEPEYICDEFDCDCEDFCKKEDEWILIGGGKCIYLGESKVKGDYRDSIKIIPR